MTTDMYGVNLRISKVVQKIIRAFDSWKLLLILNQWLKITKSIRTNMYLYY